jgi:uncharacterized protein (TIGR03435 family)
MRINHERVATVALLAAVAFLARGQQPVPLSTSGFDVASVKTISRNQRPPVRLDCSPGTFRSTVNLGLVVAWAYGFKANEIFGGQSWRELFGARFDIEAVSDRAIGLDECKSRIQSLLGERFKLALHRETRDQPVYALAVAKSGPKFREATGEPGNPSDVPSINSTPIRSALDNSSVRGLTMPQLAAFLQVELIRAEHLGGVENRPVVDRTGLTGVYQIHLDFSRRPDDDTHPDLFTALQEQLGLKLEPRKEPVEVLVVDNVEKPKEN